jgi:hypothetical protein
MITISLLVVWQVLYTKRGNKIAFSVMRKMASFPHVFHCLMKLCTCAHAVRKNYCFSSNVQHKVLRQITQLNLRLAELQNEQASSGSGHPLPTEARPIKKEPSLKAELKTEPAEYVEEYVEC